jgi:hypothetical protein
VGNTSAYQINTAEAEAATPAAGRRLLARGARRSLAQITAAQAEAEAVIAQSVENLYSLGAVAPDASVRYEWYVPDAAAPGPSDGDAVAYAYVSGVDQIKHTNAGLVGAVVIYEKGGLGKDGGNATHGGGGVRELPVFFNIQNEMQSEFFEYNLAKQTNETKIKINKLVRSRVLGPATAWDAETCKLDLERCVWSAAPFMPSCLCRRMRQRPRFCSGTHLLASSLALTAPLLASLKRPPPSSLPRPPRSLSPT